jgi:hypothetical protein
VQLRNHKRLAALLDWLLSGAGMVLRLLRPRGPSMRQERQRIQRLAEEIIEVARSMEADVRQLPRTAELEHLFAHSRECRVRAQQATSRWRRRKDLQEIGEQLHQDHWRVVSLRSELDAIMSGRPRERGTITRSCRFATGSKPVRSRWSTISSPTRPAALD